MRRRQEEAGQQKPRTITYGHNKTIHRTTHLNVETRDGKVVAVWFRCMTLPFSQHECSELRAQEMRSLYRGPSMLTTEIVAIEFLDNQTAQPAESLT